LELFLLSALVPLKKAEAAAAIRARGCIINANNQLFHEYLFSKFE
jgi:hypothetical protein